MPHVTFVPLTGFRVRDREMRALGMSLPGLSARAKAIGELPALGPLTLAGMLPDEWTCDYRGVQAVTDEVVDAIAIRSPDLVAVSALTASVLEAYELCDRLRQRNIRTVIGGLHVSCEPDEAVRHADWVCVGRGEFVWPTILADSASQNLQTRYVAPSGIVPSWPLPRFDLLPHSPPRFTLQTQTGCPFACDFCGASRLLGRFFEKPVENIRRELNAIQKLNPRPLIELADDNTFAGSRDPERLLGVLGESGARWFTEADWRIGERPDVLRHLAGAGCQQVLLGVESLVFRYPGMGQKQAELERVINAVHAIQDAGVAVNGCFIVGADGETQASLDRLIEFLLAAPFAEIQVTLQTPFPGTQLYRNLKSANRIIPERDWSFYTLFDVVYEPDTLSVVGLEAGFRRVLAAVFSQSATNRRNEIRRGIMRTAMQRRRRFRQAGQRISVDD